MVLWLYSVVVLLGGPPMTRLIPGIFLSLLFLGACAGLPGVAPAPDAPSVGSPAAPADPNKRAATGMITSIQGDKVVIKQADSLETTVTLGSGTQFLKQREASRPAVGTEVTVVTQPREGEQPALLVQIGAVSGGPNIVLSGPAPGGAPPTDGGPITFTRDKDAPVGEMDKIVMNAPIHGVIEQVDDQALVLAEKGGATKRIPLTSATRYQETAAVNRDVLQEGQLVMARGKLDGSVFRAEEVVIMSVEGNGG
jgi:hypothetical protein